MRNVKISTLLKVGMLLILFSFIGCPNATKDGQSNDISNAMAQDDIKGDGQANEKLKNTVWKTTSKTGEIEAKLYFAGVSNTCQIVFSKKEFYVAEYEIKDGKINLKLDKNIEFFKNYTVSNLIKEEENETKDAIAGMEKDLNDPKTPEKNKEALRMQIEAFKKFIKDGAFTSREKFKKFSIETMIPLILQTLEAKLNDPNVPEAEKAKYRASKEQMEAMLENPSLFDTAYLDATVVAKRQIATHLQAINPIILTLPSGQTLDTATTMAANKVYLGVDKNNSPIIQENVEFTKKS